jgi:ligand-binding SRPBCC domain-containing protein
MITLRSERMIQAPRWLCYDLVRSVEAHAAAVPWIAARAEAGKTSGLLHEGDRVLWSAIYLGVRFRTWIQVSGYDWPVRYQEQNTGGPFSYFGHDYRFAEVEESTTIISDSLKFQSPLHPFIHWFDQWVLAPLLKRALERRMEQIKQWAEGEGWKEFIGLGESSATRSSFSRVRRLMDNPGGRCAVPGRSLERRTVPAPSA